MKTISTLLFAVVLSATATAQVAKGTFTVGSTFFHYNIYDQRGQITNGESSADDARYGGWSFWPTPHASCFITDRISVGLALHELMRMSRGGHLAPYVRYYFMRNQPPRNPETNLAHGRLLPLIQLTGGFSFSSDEGIYPNGYVPTGYEKAMNLGGQLGGGLSVSISKRLALEAMLSMRHFRWHTLQPPAIPGPDIRRTGWQQDLGLYLSLSYFIKRPGTAPR